MSRETWVIYLFKHWHAAYETENEAMEEFERLISDWDNLEIEIVKMVEQRA